MAVNSMFNLFQDHFDRLTAQAVKDLVDDEVFTDVTLVAKNGESIKAHRVILIVFSKVFKKILGDNTLPNPSIYLNNTDIDILKMLKSFIYIGQCQIPSEQIDHFIKVGCDLEVEGLKDHKELEDDNLEILDLENPKDPIETPIEVNEVHLDMENNFSSYEEFVGNYEENVHTIRD